MLCTNWGIPSSPVVRTAISGQAVALGQSTLDKGAADLQALIERLAKK